MKIGITGGAGYIGSFLIKKLVEDGHEVVSIDDESIGDYRHLRELELDNKAEFLIGDIRDKEKLVKIWEKCDSVVHLAALSNLEICNEQPEEAISVNIFGTHQVMEAVKELKIPKVVFCSSASIYGEPKKLPVTEDSPLNALNLYGITKIAGEKIVNSYWMNDKIETVNLRFGNIFGIGLYTQWYAVIPKFVKQAIDGKEITIYGDGEYTRDYIHLEDITQAIINAVISKNLGGETFNLGGETITVNQIAAMVLEEFEKVTGNKPNTVNMHPRLGETKEFSYDLSKAKSMLGLTNKWTVKDGIRQIIHYCLEE